MSSPQKQHDKNCHIVLASRPGPDKETQECNFRYEETAYPEGPLGESMLLIKNLYLSFDPAMRCRLNTDTGVDYVTPFELGETVDGFAGIGEVIKSNDDKFQPGDLIIPQFSWPWKKYFTAEAAKMRNLVSDNASLSPTLHLSLFGLTGLTAYLGMKEKAHIQKGADQTVVISAAAGSTGSFAGQIAKAMGSGKLVGIAGSDAKVTCLVAELGFDAAINYKTENVAQRLKELCPNGVDVYFDNVGGDISNDIICQMNKDSHIILCGQIAAYNKTTEYPPPLPQEISEVLSAKNITRDRFLILSYMDQWESAVLALADLYQNGKIKVKETVETGLENAGRAFVSMMRGGNIGKQLLKVD